MKCCFSFALKWFEMFPPPSNKSCQRPCLHSCNFHLFPGIADDKNVQFINDTALYISQNKNCVEGCRSLNNMWLFICKLPILQRLGLNFDICNAVVTQLWKNDNQCCADVLHLYFFINKNHSFTQRVGNFYLLHSGHWEIFPLHKNRNAFTFIVYSIS